MNLLQRIFSKKDAAVEVPVFEHTPAPPMRAESESFSSSGAHGYVYARTYDGETDLGEMGPAIDYQMDHYTLRIRSKQMYVESEPCRIVINRFTAWAIGRELRLKADPLKEVLESEGITVDGEPFSKSMEARWKAYASKKLPDWSGQKNLAQLCREGHIESKKGGDMLVVLRVINGLVKIQHIDGANVANPPYLSMKQNDGILGNTGYDYYASNGNRVRLGTEINDRGEHVAYYVRTGTGLKFERVPARGAKSGMLMAYKIYGNKESIDSTSGVPLIMSIMQSAKMLKRYNDAALGGAEERQKIPLFFEHGKGSDNEDPLAGRRARVLVAQPTADAQADLPRTDDGEAKAREVAVSTKKTVINLPNEVTIKAIDSKQEINVRDFSMFNIDMICAAVEMPPNVAMCKYEDSFSASRMAGKDWEHTFMTERANFAQQYLDPIYALQMYVWVHSFKIQAPGFAKAVKEKNDIAISAYLNCRWEGDMFPDIDPLKTINYLRAATGPAFADTPFMTAEAATEIISQGDILDVLNQSKKEIEAKEKAGIKSAIPAPLKDIAPTNETPPKTRKKKTKE